MSSDDLSPWLVRGIYLFGFALMLTAAIDLFTTVWPMRPTEMAWRYGFLGLAAGYMQTPTLGMLLIILTAAWEGDAMVLRASGLFCLAVALILLVGMGLFGLDVLSMRSLRAEDAQAGVLAGGVFQEIKYFVSTFVFAFLGMGAMKTAKHVGSPAPRRDPGIVRKAG